MNYMQKVFGLKTHDKATQNIKHKYKWCCEACRWRFNNDGDRIARTEAADEPSETAKTLRSGCAVAWERDLQGRDAGATARPRNLKERRCCRRLYDEFNMWTKGWHTTGAAKRRVGERNIPCQVEHPFHWLTASRKADEHLLVSAY